MANPHPRTRVYIDGFNLYYGWLKNTPYRWLNVQRLCHLLLPNNDVQHIKYFTARVGARPNDPDQPARQDTLLRALRTLNDVDIVLGHFLTHPVTLPKHPISNPPTYVKVIKTEEKGSDVNLATHLLIDGFQDVYDVAFVISNDSDLLLPIQQVRKLLRKKVGIAIPNHKPSVQLSQNCDFRRQIRAGALAASQFPTTMTDQNGTFNKPVGW